VHIGILVVARDLPISLRRVQSARNSLGKFFVANFPEFRHRGGYFLPLLIKEGLTFSGRFADSAVFG
jgi:hypothetical protein